MTRTGKTPVYNHVWYEQNQGKICPQSSESPKVFAVSVQGVNSLRPRQNGRRFADDTFKRIFLNENVWIWIKISLKFVPKGPINNIPALVQIMAWRRPGDKPLSEAMTVNLPTHICVTRPQWVNILTSSVKLPSLECWRTSSQTDMHKSTLIQVMTWCH